MRFFCAQPFYLWREQAGSEPPPASLLPREAPSDGILLCDWRRLNDLHPVAIRVLDER